MHTNCALAGEKKRYPRSKENYCAIMEFPSLPGGDLVNPLLLAPQFGHLSLQDKAFLDAFNRQEQQESHGVPRPGPVDPTTLQSES